MFKGSMVAIVTPMDEDYTIDKKAFCSLLDWHIESGTNAIIVAGTTGESPTLTAQERYDLTALAVKHSAGRIPIITGAGTNSTESTLKLAEDAKRAGADATLLVTPYYNKPPQKGLYEHYKFIAEKVSMPHIIYNVPSRTACDLLPETLERLAKIKNIIGIKEATGKIERAEEIQARCGNNFMVYSGDDITGLSLMSKGAQGIMSVTANIAPKKMSAMCQAALTLQWDKAKKLNEEMLGLHTDLYLEANPIPTKWALSQMGLIRANIRLPLVSLDKKYHPAVKAAMEKAGVLIHEFS